MALLPPEQSFESRASLSWVLGSRLLGATMVVGILLVVGYMIARQTAVSQRFTHETKALTTSLANAVAVPLSQNDPQSAVTSIELFETHPFVHRVQLVTADGFAIQTPPDDHLGIWLTEVQQKVRSEKGELGRLTVTYYPEIMTTFLVETVSLALLLLTAMVGTMLIVGRQLIRRHIARPLEKIAGMHSPPVSGLPAASNPLSSAHEVVAVYETLVRHLQREAQDALSTNSIHSLIDHHPARITRIQGQSSSHNVIGCALHELTATLGGTGGRFEPDKSWNDDMGIHLGPQILEKAPEEHDNDHGGKNHRFTLRNGDLVFGYIEILDGSDDLHAQQLSAAIVSVASLTLTKMMVEAAQARAQKDRDVIDRLTCQLQRQLGRSTDDTIISATSWSEKEPRSWHFVHSSARSHQATVVLISVPRSGFISSIIAGLVGQTLTDLLCDTRAVDTPNQIDQLVDRLDVMVSALANSECQLQMLVVRRHRTENRLDVRTLNGGTTLILRGAQVPVDIEVLQASGPDAQHGWRTLESDLDSEDMVIGITDDLWQSLSPESVPFEKTLLRLLAQSGAHLSAINMTDLIVETEKKHRGSDPSSTSYALCAIKS